jgi:tetratricopeptide (TPR) repeat protein
MRELALSINEAIDRPDIVKLEQLDEVCASLLKTYVGPQAATIWYYRSNIQAALQDLTDPQSWKWRQPHRERQILYLRRARSQPGFSDLHSVIRAQVITNLANSLNTLGRGIEAMLLYDEALREQPKFAMALANRGIARMEFARALHDRGHAAIILLGAYEDLVAALSPNVVWDSDYPGIHKQITAKSQEIEAILDIARARQTANYDQHSLGRTKKERAYRKWALEWQLFLNPLNVLGAHSIAATDRFGLPTHHSTAGEPPQYIEWFNQLKQEFTTARLLIFEALGTSANHFADRELMLIDTLDYAAFGVRYEKMRLAFRTAYSLLDKVAGFINAYFKLGKRPERVNLRNVWLSNSETICPELADRSNLWLRGLYWLAFDIIGKEQRDPEAIEPEASELYRLRNALEHRCLILQEIETSRASSVIDKTTVDAFHDHTIMMVRLAQASIIYLSLAIGREERVRAKVNGGLTESVQLPVYNSRRRNSLFKNPA